MSPTITSLILLAPPFDLSVGPLEEDAQASPILRLTSTVNGPLILPGD